MKMEVMIGDRVELREVAYVSAGVSTHTSGQNRVPVLHDGEKLVWVFGSTIPRIVKRHEPT